jgi:hypothetical protein
MLFLHDLERREIGRVSTSKACSGVEVLEMALVVLEQALIDTWIVSEVLSPVARDTHRFIHAVGTHSLRFRPEVGAHRTPLVQVRKLRILLLHQKLLMLCVAILWSIIVTICEVPQLIAHYF